MIGEQWSARSQELRDAFTRNRIPIGFYDVGTARGREMLDDLGLVSPDLPVVVLRFAAQHSTLALLPRPAGASRQYQALAGTASRTGMPGSARRPGSTAPPAAMTRRP